MTKARPLRFGRGDTRRRPLAPPALWGWGLDPPLNPQSAIRNPQSKRPPSCFSPAADAGDRKQAARFNAETAEKGADWGKANDKQQ